MNRILCLKGDGIGPEIVESAVAVLEKISSKYEFEYELEYEYFGGASIDEYGVPFSDSLKEKIKTADAIW